MLDGIRTKALQRAAEMVGGPERLREILGVSVSELDAWLSGAEMPPMDVFLAAVDILSTPIDGDAQRRFLNERRQAQRQQQQQRNLRHKLHISRLAMKATRERSQAILATALAGRIASAAARGKPLSALAFLQTRYTPADGARMVEAALGAAVTATSATMGTLQIARPEGLLLIVQHGFDKPFLDYFSVTHEGTCGAAAKKAERVIVDDVATHPIFAGTPAEPVMAEANVRAVQSTPLVAPSGELVGMVSTHFDRAWRPSDRELDVVDHIARRAAFWLDGGAL